MRLSDQSTAQAIDVAAINASFALKTLDSPLSVDGDEMEYTQSTILDIYDKRSYDHKDVSTLTRVT